MCNNSIFISLLTILLLLSGCASTQSLASQESSIRRSYPESSSANNETVVLLHGLNRTARSMRSMSTALSEAGYRVCSIGYPSRYFNIEVLARDYVLPKINECVGEKTKAVNFVTHSLGGIMVRQLDTELKSYPPGKLVMLSPPNQGSVAVDKLSHTWFFQQIAGPAGSELGTSADSIPKNLPAPSMSFAVIAARHSNSPMSLIIPGDDDGKVSLDNMQLAEMADFTIVNSTHSFMMTSQETIKLVLEFFKYGRFTKSEKE